MRIGSNSVLACTVSALVWAGCSKDVLFQEVTQTSVSASGGRAVSADGDLQLDVPQGTLQTATKITIRTVRDSTNHASLAKPIYDLSADPPVTEFDPVIEIRFVNVPDDGRKYVLVNTDQATPVEVAGSTHDQAARTVRGTLSHFSGYSIAPEGPAWECPPEDEAIGASCSEEGARCDYGQECCCGQCYTAFTCTCSGGSLGCMYTDACLIPSCPGDAGVSNDAGSEACPATEPIGESCSTDGLQCNYGQECCCGQCYNAIECTCQGTSFACMYTDACLIPGCPDAG